MLKSHFSLFYSQLLIEHDYLEKLITSIQKENEALPLGRLYCNKNGNYVKWLFNDGNESKYLSKENVELAKKLARKHLNNIELDNMLWEKKLLDENIRHYKNRFNITESIMKKADYFQRLTMDSYVSENNWKESYSQNPYYPESLIHKTMAGHMVRSKSESIISNALYMNGISYQYECELKLGDNVFYPDFKIYKEREHRIIYWEHFGLVDQTQYRNAMLNKIRIYGEHDILPPDNLIMTFETQSVPLDANEVQHIIQRYFL